MPVIEPGITREEADALMRPIMLAALWVNEPGEEDPFVIAAAEINGVRRAVLLWQMPQRGETHVAYAPVLGPVMLGDNLKLVGPNREDVQIIAVTGPDVQPLLERLDDAERRKN